MLTTDSQELMRWYEERVRPFFESNLEEGKVQAFEKDHDRLQRIANLAKTELAVCFLGNSGVGKSTLSRAE